MGILLMTFMFLGAIKNVLKALVQDKTPFVKVIVLPTLWQY
jgi:hypothetical protein